MNIYNEIPSIKAFVLTVTDALYLLQSGIYNMDLKIELEEDEVGIALIAKKETTGEIIKYISSEEFRSAMFVFTNCMDDNGVPFMTEEDRDGVNTTHDMIDRVIEIGGAYVVLQLVMYGEVYSRPPAEIIRQRQKQVPDNYTVVNQRGKA